MEFKVVSQEFYIADYSVFPAALNDDLVDRLLALYDKYPSVEGTTLGEAMIEMDIATAWPDLGDLDPESLNQEEKEQFDKEIAEYRDHLMSQRREAEKTSFEVRKCRKHPISLLDETWFVNILERFAKVSNHKWMLDIDTVDQLELLEYSEGEDGYKWHRDCDILSHEPRNRCRKLSIIVQLSDPSDYEGCDLEISNEDTQTEGDTDVTLQQKDILKQKGTVIVFPSFQKHRITPLISGNRKSLVAWVGGAPWK